MVIFSIFCLINSSKFVPTELIHSHQKKVVEKEEEKVFQCNNCVQKTTESAACWHNQTQRTTTTRWKIANANGKFIICHLHIEEEPRGSDFAVSEWGSEGTQGTMELRCNERVDHADGLTLLTLSRWTPRWTHEDRMNTITTSDGANSWNADN